VRLKLIGGDVIHSFWVPQLAGKMDAIPGQTNETWIEADSPGTYRGQCTEYCGLEHARMAMLVVAQSPAEFQAWWTHQLVDPPAPQGVALTGQQAFQSHCASCHAVRGTDAAGALGPDLSHLMQRATIAAGVLPNDDATLAHWIADPQSLKPGSLMPAPELTGQDLANVHAYLKTLG
jgi:cytochrome c oxidase subunit 2